MRGRGISGADRRAGQEQEVLGHADEPVDVLEARGQHLLVFLRRARRAQRHLDPALQRGERRAQLVGRIGGEAAHLPEGLVEPREHAVERLGEPVQLVLGALPSDALVQVLGGDAAGRRRHLVDRSERLPRDDGAARGRQADPERDQDEQRLQIAAQHALGSAERAADLDDPDDPVRSTIGIVRIRTCSRSCVIVSKVLMPRRALA